VRKLLAIGLSIVVCGCVVAEAAVAKGLDMAAPGGVTVSGSEHRYVAISPGTPRAVTVVARVQRDGGRLSRFWYLRGRFHVPAVAYDRTPGGLSADGRTLVLSRTSRPRVYPPRSSEFAILDTQRPLAWRGRGRPPRFRQLADFVDLRGHYSFDAISPDGSTVYLIHHHLPPSSGGAYIATYEVRALDLRSGRLLPRPIVDPSEPDEKMQGLPISRASGPDGRWAYTLYDGNGGEPFVHALDTVGRRAVCIDLPQLEGRRNLFLLSLRMEEHGRALTVLDGKPGLEGTEALLSVDTESFEVGKPATAGVAESGLPWLPVGIAVVGLLSAVAWVARGRRSAVGGRPDERA
jgi:hypothetical protein